MRKKQTRQGQAQVVAQTMRIVGREVGLASPVRSGRLRSNWKANISGSSSFGPAYQDLGNYKPSPYFQTPDWRETSGPNQKAMELQHATVAAFYRNPEQTLWITNATPYLAKNNAGGVVQTPQGYVERGLDRSPPKLQHLRIYGARLIRGGRV